MNLRSTLTADPTGPLPAGRAGGPVTAFVLAGGGSLGALQAGMVRALYERGVVPDLIVGTSAGGLNGAFLASRPPTISTSRSLAAIWRKLRREDLFPLNPRRALGGLTNQRDHLVSDAAIRRLVSRHLEIDDLAEAAIPLHLVAFDLLSGEEVLLSTGSAMEATLAAAAIPGVLPPIRRGGRVLVDGGVVNNTPISHAVSLGATRIYVLSTGATRALPVAPRGALDAVVHAFMLLVGSRLEADLQRYADVAEIIVLPAINRHRVQPTDFGHADRLIGEGLSDARQALGALPAALELAA